MSVVSALDIHRAVSESREKGGGVVISQSQIVRSCSSMALYTSNTCFRGNYYDILYGLHKNFSEALFWTLG